MKIEDITPGLNNNLIDIGDDPSRYGFTAPTGASTQAIVYYDRQGNRVNPGSPEAYFTSPTGGYFISVNTISGTAKRVGELASSAGLNITPPGATFPYGVDPQDSNLRIAPTYAGLDELNSGLKLLSLCIKIAALENRLNKANQIE